MSFIAGPRLILFTGVGPGVTPPKIRGLPREPQQCSVPGLAFLAVSCYNRLMRSYVGCIDLYGLRRSLLEDAVPRNLLRQLVQERFSRTTTVVPDDGRVAVDDPDDHAMCWGLISSSRSRFPMIVGVRTTGDARRA